MGWEKAIMTFILHDEKGLPIKGAPDGLQKQGWAYNIKDWEYGAWGVADVRSMFVQDENGYYDDWRLVHHPSKSGTVTLCNLRYAKKMAEILMKSDINWDFDTLDKVEAHNKIDLKKVFNDAELEAKKLS